MRGIRTIYTCVLLCGLPIAGFGAEWGVDWGQVLRMGEAVAREWQDGFDGRHVQEVLAQVEVDWTLAGRFIDEALDGYSWEDLAWLRPYAAALLERMEQMEQGVAGAAWLRQRLAYLDMAENYVAASRTRQSEVPKPVEQKPEPSVPARREEPRAVRPVVHSVSWDADTAAWLARVPEEPVAFARRTVPELMRIFEQEGIPRELVWLAEVESSFNPSARSPAGAVGLFQFMPATATRFGLALQPEDERLSPGRSAEAAARYLRILHRRFADWPLALAAYNAGEGRVGRILRQSEGRQFVDIADRLPLETRMYVPRIAALVQKREGADIRQLPSPR